MASSPDGVAYSYANVALYGVVVSDAVAYEYINVGVKPTPNWIGRLVGYAAPRSDAAAYEYINVT